MRCLTSAETAQPNAVYKDISGLSVVFPCTAQNTKRDVKLFSVCTVAEQVNAELTVIGGAVGARNKVNPTFPGANPGRCSRQETLFVIE